MEIKQIPLCDLKSNPENVRKTKPSQTSMDRLVASINHNGLLKNLLVKKNGKGYVVTDGNRRLEALQGIYGNDSGQMIDCKVLEDNVSETDVGLHANMMHEDMHPMDECEAIERICLEGHGDYDSIAAQFGRTTLWVQQRIKLADLSDKAKRAFRNMEFGINVAQALTLGSHKDQNKFLKDQNGRKIRPQDVYWFFDSGRVSADKAIFDIEGHEEALGVVKDLFSEDVWITNQKVFEKMTDDYLDDLVAKHSKKSYKSVILLRDEAYFSSPRCKNLERPDKRQKDSDTHLVLQYFPTRGEIDTIRLVEKPVEDTKATGVVGTDGKEIEVPEETQYELSKPQQFMLTKYRDEFLRQNMFHNLKEFNYANFYKAIIVMRSIHPWDYDHNFIGDGEFENKCDFNAKAEVSNELYVSDHKVFIDQVYDNAIEHIKSNGGSLFSYYYNLDGNTLDTILGVIAIRSCRAYDFESKEFKEVYDFTIDEKTWFQPEKNWLSKYPLTKLKMLYKELFDNVEPQFVKKTDLVDAIYAELKAKGGFNIYQK